MYYICTGKGYILYEDTDGNCLMTTAWLRRPDDNQMTFPWTTTTKGQTNSKLFFQANVSSKKQTSGFYFTTMKPQVAFFVRFLEEIEDTKKIFRNYLTFNVFREKTLQK